MNQTVTLLLLGLGSGDVTPAERRALATFQAREKVTLVPAVSLSGGAAVSLSGGAPAPPRAGPTVSAPRAGAPTVLLGGGAASTQASEGVAIRVEEELEEAQTLSASLDEERALVILANIEQELIAHPELPQAAWLMAERHSLTAGIVRKRPGGADEADRLVASARAFEGPRAVSFGEGAPVPLTSGPTSLLNIRDLDPFDALVLDGRAAKTTENVLPGRHHARVLRGSRVAWSGWFDVPAEARADELLGVPARVACSRDDLGDVATGLRSPSVPRGVRCERWVGVRRRETGLEVAWCAGGRCTAYGPLLYEQKAAEAPANIPPWVAATIVGAATIGAASLLIATGAFDRDRPPPVSVTVYRGPP